MADSYLIWSYQNHQQPLMACSVTIRFVMSILIMLFNAREYSKMVIFTNIDKIKLQCFYILSTIGKYIFYLTAHSTYNINFRPYISFLTLIYSMIAFKWYKNTEYC